MSDTRTRYVLGFMINLDHTRVALIRKNRPKWQSGKLNGIGGGLEPGEVSATAMPREFHEETGHDTGNDPNYWSHFGRICRENGNDNDFSVDLYAAYGPLDELVSVTDEKVEIVDIASLYGRTDVIDNLPWLVALAVNHLQSGSPGFVKASY